MNIQQEQACRDAYSKLVYWGVDFLDFVEFAEKLDKEQKAYDKKIKEGHEKLQKQLAEQAIKDRKGNKKPVLKEQNNKKQSK